MFDPTVRDRLLPLLATHSTPSTASIPSAASVERLPEEKQTGRHKQREQHELRPRSPPPDDDDDEDRRPFVVLIDRGDLRELYPTDWLRPRRALVNHGEVLQTLEATLSDRFRVRCFRADTEGDVLYDHRAEQLVRGFEAAAGLFGGAAAVVGVHGAGLSNALFAAAAAAGYASVAPPPSPAPSPSPSPSPSLSTPAKRKLIEIVPGASSFHSEYALLAGALGLEHHAYVVPGVGWGDDVEVRSPRHLAAAVRAALLPAEVAAAAGGGRHQKMFDALHGQVLSGLLGGGRGPTRGGTEEDVEFNDARPFRRRSKNRKTHG